MRRDRVTLESRRFLCIVECTFSSRNHGKDRRNYNGSSSFTVPRNSAQIKRLNFPQRIVTTLSTSTLETRVALLINSSDLSFDSLNAKSDLPAKSRIHTYTHIHIDAKFRKAITIARTNGQSPDDIVDWKSCAPNSRLNQITRKSKSADRNSQYCARQFRYYIHMRIAIALQRISLFINR